MPEPVMAQCGRLTREVPQKVACTWPVLPISLGVSLLLPINRTSMDKAN
jgi:hypothetical protein